MSVKNYIYGNCSEAAFYYFIPNVKNKFPLEHNQIVTQKMMVKIKPILKNMNMIMHSYVGKDHKNKHSADFYAIHKNNLVSIQIKSTMNKQGKVCPSVIGQPTSKKFDEFWKLPYKGESSYHEERFCFIKKNIKSFLREQLKYFQLCDYLIIIENCKDESEVTVLKKIPNDWFNDKKIKFNQTEYSDFDVNIQRQKEFSSTIKVVLNKTELTIGEVQFHYKSRNVVKFRFDKKFLKNVD